MQEILNSTPTNLGQLLQTAIAEIAKTSDDFTLEQIRSKYLGKKSPLTDLLKSIATLPVEERPLFGQKINVAKEQLQELLQEQKTKIKASQLEAELKKDAVDITLPGRGQKLGSLHPITKIRYEIEEFFTKMGFAVIEGPEIEDDYHNFTALNFPPHHPARHMHDTFYFPDGKLLRTHTSTLQVRVMENSKPPFRVIAPGRTYRCDSDATHSPMFHQLEGFVVDSSVSFADLKWLISKFIEDFFGAKTQFRFRASYFPFTEPSAEVDILWNTKDGKTRWLEVSGCGMIHPNVLKEVKVDPEKYSGFAFGFGLDRLAMLRYGIDDLRLFFENDVKFLEQF